MRDSCEEMINPSFETTTRILMNIQDTAVTETKGIFCIFNGIASGIRTSSEHTIAVTNPMTYTLTRTNVLRGGLRT